MAITLSFNGQNYLIPETGEVGWGDNLDDFFVAIPAGCLQKIGGSFTLASEVDFGASFGLKSLYYKSRGSNPSSTGIFRMENAASGIGWRNAANNADLLLTVNSSNALTYNGAPLATTALTDGHIFVGNVSNIATDVAMTGDISITNAGVTAIGAGVIVNADVNAAAAIAYSKLNLSASIVNADIASAAAIAVAKLAALTASRAVVTDGSGFLAAATTTATEIGYVNGVTSAIQTQLDAKEPTITTLPVSKGGTGATSFTAYSVLCGGTTSTNPVQNVSGVGASGQVLTSGGAGSLPTWQNATGSGTVNSGTAGRLTLYPTSTNTVGDTYVQNSQNINVAIAAHAALASTRTYTIPELGVDGTFMFLQGGQTVTGAKTFASSTLLLQEAGSTDTVTVAVATLATSRTYTVPDAGAAAAFVMTEGAQAINGAKTFASSTLLLQEAGSTDVVTIAVATLAASRVYTLPDAGAAASFVMTEGAQTVNGVKTFGSSPVISTAGGASLLITSSSGLSTVFQTIRNTGTSNADWSWVIAPSGTSLSLQNNGTSLTVAAARATTGNLEVHGTNTNDSATAGYVGEYVESVVSAVNFPTSGQYGDAASISLTSGDWDVTLVGEGSANGATVTLFIVGVSVTSGNSATGLVDGSNKLTGFSPSAAGDSCLTIANYRLSLSGTTTVYAKFRGSYSVATPQFYGRLSARRVR